MKATLKTITPEIAANMLKLNVSNRPLRESNFLALAKEMRSGRWKVNGDMIRLSDNNIIIDGQHRLQAVVRSGVTIQSWVMEGLPIDVFDTIDVGKRRSAGDTLGCAGEKNACRMAAALILIDKYFSGKVENTIQYTNTDVQSLLQKHPDIRTSLVTTINGKGLLLPSVLDACYYLFSKKDPVLADIFIEKVTKGIGLSIGDPWYVLRERLVANSTANSKLSKALMMALCIKAWNACRQGRNITSLKLNMLDGRMVAFPVVI